MDLDETTVVDLFRRAATQRVPGSGTMGCSIPIILWDAGSIISTVSVPGIGDITTMPSWNEMVNWSRARLCVDDFTTEAMSFIERTVERGKPFFVYAPQHSSVRCRSRIDGGTSSRTEAGGDDA